MTTRIINRQFSDIVRILLESPTNYDMYLKSGTSKLTDPGFIETDFKYTQEKLMFDDPSVLNELVDSDKNRISSAGYVEIVKYLSTLFPTNVESSGNSSNTHFFSTLENSFGEEIYCILVPEGITRVRMYGDEFDASIEITFDNTEIGHSKILTMLVSYGTSPRILNLSYSAYQGDANPNRVMSDYVLRNDSLIDNYKGYHEENGYLYSSISNSLIGTSQASDRPIYELLKSFLGSDNSWKKAKRYSVGDRAMVGTTIYESLESNNIGNHPYYSRKWCVKYDN